MPYDSILETIGNTPHVRVNRLLDPRVSVWVKQERANPGGSIKDRIALGMIEDAEKEGSSGRARSSSNRPQATRASVSRWSAPSRTTG